MSAGSHECRPRSAERGGEASSTRELAAFLAVVGDSPDPLTGIVRGVERAARTLEADHVAFLHRGEVVHAAGDEPGADVPVSAFRTSRVTDGMLHVVRAAPLSPEELALAQGMAHMLGLAVQHEAVVGALRDRQRLLEGLSEIQRSISRHAPLPDVFDAIVGLAGELLDDELPALVLRDPDDLDTLVLAASRGHAVDLLDATARRPVGVGVAGTAVAENRLVVAEDYAAFAGAMSPLVDLGMRAAMAAPIHHDGHAVGALIVSSYRADRRYGPAEREMLLTIAQHASLALTDAQTMNAMVHQALHDNLTGLPNRALFGDRLAHALERSRRAATGVAVLFVDLDRFKTVNDSLGHAAGDAPPTVVADRIGECMRGADTASRLGGDEFAVLLEDVAGDDEAVAVAERIIAAIEAPVVLEGREVFVGASIGIARGRQGPTDLLRMADVAMYRAKAEGRNRWVLYEEGMQAEVLERLELEADLRRALARDELELHYQPIIGLATGALEGVEALVRWRHPTRGLVLPGAFIPLAEETGMIVAIGDWVLREACRQAAAWRAAGAGGDVTTNVNISGRQLDDPRLLETVREALEETGLPARSLVLEITETVLMGDTEATIERLDAIRALGVRLAVDDFGTGYSSLRYLNRFPVDVLKMAKTFVDGLDTGAEEHLALARTIVDLGASLGLQIIAEGIERPEQLAQLRRLGCELGQGFHFGLPLPADELEPQIVGARRPVVGVAGWM